MPTTTVAIPEGTASSSPSQDYIEHLESELAITKRCLDEAMADATKSNAEYQDAKAWKTELKAYLDAIDVTLDLACDVLACLNSTKSQSESVCENIRCTIDAIKVLVLEVKEASECLEELKAMIKDLLNRIECLNDPVLDPGTSVVKCIVDLQTKVNEAIQATLAAITEVLNVFKQATVLMFLICKMRDVSGDDVDTSSLYSLIHNLETMIQLVKCGEISGSAPADSNPHTSEEPCYGLWVQEPSCSVNPKPCLLIPRSDDCPDGSCSTDDYKTNTQHKFDAACDLVSYKKCLWENAVDAKNMAQSRYDALSGALEAAKAAKQC